MPIPATKTQLLKAIDDRFAKLDRALNEVPVDRADEQTMAGHAKGTHMSPNNLLSYLIGWNTLVLKWLEHDARGLPIAFPDDGYRWNELGALAQKFYRDHSSRSYTANREYLSRVKDQLVAEVYKRSDDELYGSPWHGKWTMGRMIQLNTSSPYENARARLRKWLKANHGFD